MNKGTLALLISGLITIPTAAMAMTPNTDLNLMPYPQNVEWGRVKSHWINPSAFTSKATIHRACSSTPSAPWIVYIAKPAYQC